MDVGSAVQCYVVEFNSKMLFKTFRRLEFLNITDAFKEPPLLHIRLFVVSLTIITTTPLSAQSFEVFCHMPKCFERSTRLQCDTCSGLLAKILFAKVDLGHSLSLNLPTSQVT